VVLGEELVQHCFFGRTPMRLEHLRVLHGALPQVQVDRIDFQVADAVFADLVGDDYVCHLIEPGLLDVVLVQHVLFVDNVDLVHLVRDFLVYHLSLVIQLAHLRFDGRQEFFAARYFDGVVFRLVVGHVAAELDFELDFQHFVLDFGLPVVVAHFSAFLLLHFGQGVEQLALGVLAV